MPPLFVFSDLHFSYPGHPSVLQGACFQLHPAERLAITGPNGAGKSTLLHILVGLLRPTSGRIWAFGQDRVQEKDFHTVRQRAGYVFQDPDDQLFCPTVAEDVAFGPLNLGKSRSEALEIVTRVLDQLGLSQFHDRVTHKLSGGEKRLVSLAAVLAMEPDVLLLDEPTNALDEATTERLVQILNSLPQAMILVSHDRRFRSRIQTRALRLESGLLGE
jgi:cobalt/nickel transport system ATP-binding protein